MEPFCVPASCIEEFSFLHTSPHSAWSVFISAILIGAYWYLIAFPVVSDIEHLRICLFALCMPSLGMCLFKSLSYIFTYYYWALRILYLFWIQVFCQIHDLQRFSPSPWLTILFSYKCSEKNMFWFLSSSLYWFVLLWIILLGKLLPNCPKI